MGSISALGEVDRAITSRCTSALLRIRLPQVSNAIEAMRYRLKTREGKAVYAQRKSTLETVFGIIK